MIPDYLKGLHPTYDQFKASRARPGIPTARAALWNAKYGLYRKALLRRWADAGGETVEEFATSDWELGYPRVRIVEIADIHVSMDDLKGDCYNPKVCDINPNRLKREEREFEERVAREGVWGYRAEVWDGTDWIETDSIYGFVGNDFNESCYDDDLMESALDRLDEILAAEARAFEAERPDMYAA